MLIVARRRNSSDYELFDMDTLDQAIDLVDALAVNDDYELLSAGNTVVGKIEIYSLNHYAITWYD